MSTALALPTEGRFNERQIRIIREQIAKGTSEDEFALFLEVCQMTGLNPFQRQIYAIMRGTGGERRMTIQTGIDGYRLIAARKGQLAGIDDPVYDSEEAEHPTRASVTVWRFVGVQRVPFTATARWKEYKPEKAPMWDRMPYLMLGKCAEALALRKAFPAELSGIYTGDEMAQADTDMTPYVEAAPTQAPRPTPIRQAPPATNTANSKRPARALYERWVALQRDGDPTDEETYATRFKTFVQHGPPYTPVERARWVGYITTLEQQAAEREHDLATVEVTPLGA